MRLFVRISPVLTLPMLAACGADPGIINPSQPEIMCTIPESDIISGGQPPDGIPALSLSEVVAVDGEPRLANEERVLGVVVNGVARAYPYPVMWWHEIANDTLGGENIVVTFCPLTGSGLVFSSVVDGVARDFGVSGLLYENNLILFDRGTRSLWNQLLMGAQCGDLAGTSLTRIPIIDTTWEHWKSMYPQSTVVSFRTGYSRDYTAYPYGSYDEPDNPELLFPSSAFSGERPPKEPVLGLQIGRVKKGYPFGYLRDTGTHVALNETVSGTPVLVTYFDDVETAAAFERHVPNSGFDELTFTVTDPGNKLLTDAETGSTWDAGGVAVAGALTGSQLTPVTDAHTMFWFAWAVFHPNAVVYRAP